MHVDQRPRLMFMVGLALMALASMTGYFDATEKWLNLLQEVKVQYKTVNGVELEPTNYLWDCLSKATCRQAYMNAWGAPLWEQVLLHTSFLVGLIFVGFSRFWRPEQWFYRRARVDAGRMDEWRERSSEQPKGTLRVVRPKG